MPWEKDLGSCVPFEGGVRCGAVRQSMETNSLLTKGELGKAKKCQFNNPPSDHTFGYTPTKDPEGARSLTSYWKEHQPSTSSKPKPDFKAMNKLAVDNGCTTSKQLPGFRQENLILQKTAKSSATKSPNALPSDKDTTFTYGVPSAYRSAEVIRTHGPAEPPLKYLVQGAYQDDWVNMNMQRDLMASKERPYIPPVPTKAALGHSSGASKYINPPTETEPWKMTKFRNVDSRVYSSKEGGVQ
eukprot:CAMPEP_0175054542 /NCGR_PEP_ID=MMETSP0052_2-20121109/9563_1 /TAXON_ID=51329 ORGANISM="Polytomella parva, Strain SAG 63-3" /NCGR_SAMPLE_ID=MMETSP0052_2 /ASSEMBLY_ACC=CAM_ASM_000194 /LENGTH=241 /DNA_ID=CAMNT_0016319249 /DNA_START=47 /DNA_END=772 /DNA_ORIENTATION=+